MESFRHKARGALDFVPGVWMWWTHRVKVVNVFLALLAPFAGLMIQTCFALSLTLSAWSRLLGSK
ncbi:MAG: hypothetical protein DME26_02795 [Verrucomicrobia bacterium]|nr:MAG: hypothetical protein DME26_02795 [Verrucomicrobiota bacterium]